MEGARIISSSFFRASLSVTTLEAMVARAFAVGRIDCHGITLLFRNYRYSRGCVAVFQMSVGRVVYKVTKTHDFSLGKQTTFHATVE